MPARAVAAACMVAVGCGRIHFDEGSADDTQVGSGCAPTVAFGAPVPVPAINDPALYDSSLYLAPDELTGYFYRTTTSDDIYAATRSDVASPFTVAPVASLNSVTTDAHPAVSLDGTLMVFYSTRAPSIGGDLWYAVPFTTDWTVVGQLTALNSATVDYHPYFQTATNDFYFSSDRSGDFAIYHSTYVGTMFAAPTRVSELDVVGANDNASVISPDGLTMFFRTDRGGNYDIWIATRGSPTEAFGSPRPVTELNSPDIDTPNWISADGCRLYLSSSRAGAGDIFVATRGG